MLITFPLNTKYFKTIHSIHEGKVDSLDDELVNYLVYEGYILSQGKFGWALTNKGREFLKQFGHDRTFIDVIRADWPTDLLAVLRRCEFNSSPGISVKKLDDLVNTGYLTKSAADEYFVTEKGAQVLATFHE